MLVFPSVMDPAGILMLRSVRIVFEKVGIPPESMKFKKEQFNSLTLVKAITEKPKKCLAIVTLDIIIPLYNTVSRLQYTHVYCTNTHYITVSSAVL